MDPLRFAAELLDQEGAAVEPSGEGVDVLLPAELAERLGWGEEAHLVPQSRGERAGVRSVGYGTSDLEQLLDLARSNGSVVCFRLEIDPPAMRDLAADLRRSFRFHTKGPVSFGSAIRSIASYLRLHCAYTAVSEESHEGLFCFAVNESTLAPLPGSLVLTEDPRQPLRSGALSAGPGAQSAARVLEVANRHACRLALSELAGFLSSLERRRRRDRDRLHAYYQSLVEELTIRKGRGRAPSKTTVEERMATIKSELDRKIRDLDLRYALRVRVRAVAVERITMPILHASCRLRWKQTERSLPIVWNPVLHDLEPLPCQGCGAATKELFVSEELAIHCAACSSGK